MASDKKDDAGKYEEDDFYSEHTGVAHPADTDSVLASHEDVSHPEPLHGFEDDVTHGTPYDGEGDLYASEVEALPEHHLGEHPAAQQNAGAGHRPLHEGHAESYAPEEAAEEEHEDPHEEEAYTHVEDHGHGAEEADEPHQPEIAAETDKKAASPLVKLAAYGAGGVAVLFAAFMAFQQFSGQHAPEVPPGGMPAPSPVANAMTPATLPMPNLPAPPAPASPTPASTVSAPAALPAVTAMATPPAGTPGSVPPLQPLPLATPQAPRPPAGATLPALPANTNAGAANPAMPGAVMASNPQKNAAVLPAPPAMAASASPQPVSQASVSRVPFSQAITAKNQPEAADNSEMEPKIAALTQQLETVKQTNTQLEQQLRQTQSMQQLAQQPAQQPGGAPDDAQEKQKISQLEDKVAALEQQLQLANASKASPSKGVGGSHAIAPLMPSAALSPANNTLPQPPNPETAAEINPPGTNMPATNSPASAPATAAADKTALLEAEPESSTDYRRHHGKHHHHLARASSHGSRHHARSSDGEPVSVRHVSEAEQLQREENAKLGIVEPGTAVSAAPPESPPVRAMASKHSSRPAKAGWVLRSAQPGYAWLSQGDSTELRRVIPGDKVAGLGTIVSVQQQAGHWVVEGTKGKVQ